MTVAELIALLQEQPQDMKVVVDFHSDYSLAEGISIVQCLETDWGVMTAHYTMDPEKLAKAKNYILIS